MITKDSFHASNMQIINQNNEKLDGEPIDVDKFIRDYKQQQYDNKE